MKKILTFIAALMMMLTGAASAENPYAEILAESVAPAVYATEALQKTANQTAAVTLNIRYTPNRRFSIYDADIYLDDAYIGTVVQGTVETCTIPNVSTGTYHEIAFYDCMDYSKHNGRHTICFVPKCDMIIDCTIMAFRDGIVVSEKTFSGEQNSSAPTSGTYTLDLDIDYVFNAVMAKYNIEICVDGQKVATVGNGKRRAVAVRLSSGRHAITFYKEGGHSISKSISIFMNGDSDFRCHLISHLDKIEAKDISTTASLR